ncbi:transposase [Lacticaseibacillus paracasei]|nr:transposase [Lacticaseibacillus paracasei]
MTDHFKGRQFNQSVITFAAGYYLRYNISYRDGSGANFPR